MKQYLERIQWCRSEFPRVSQSGMNQRGQGGVERGQEGVERGYLLVCGLTALYSFCKVGIEYYIRRYEPIAILVTNIIEKREHTEHRT